MGKTYAAVDWEAGPLGAVSSWSPTLLGVLDLIMNTRFPITLLWGPQFALVYNDAYAPLIVEKHPHALGQPAEAVFPEAWHLVGPMMEAVRDGQGANWVEDEYVPLYRRGFLEECYFTFSYSPVHNPDGVVEGVMDIATETTEQVISRRRLHLLSRVTEALADVEHLEDIPRVAVPLLRSALHDFAAVDIRLDGVGGKPTGDLPDWPAHRPREDAECIADHRNSRVAWLRLGSTGSSDRSYLVVALSPLLAPDEQYLEFLRLVAAAIRQALDRVRAWTAERRTAEAQKGIAEAFQRSLLPSTPTSGSPEVAVRYQPAVELAQVGGDWYDLFELPDGSLAVVVGDVAGHDRQAAAAMAKVRNMTRGVAYAMHPDPPSRVLERLDRAMYRTARDIVATAVLAQVAADKAGLLTMTWANAGHLPPVLIEPDGSTRLLEMPADLLLGLDEGARRVDHEIELKPGSTVVLYTDGLIERRGVPISAGLDWLTELLQDQQNSDVEELCDYVLRSAGAGTLQDDVALLALRA